MNGGRGAKGSINDRLISMMYRHRYKLAEQRKRGYKKEDKTRQKEYLQAIQNFDIEDGVLDLDAEDKEVVEGAFNIPGSPDTEAPISQTEVPFTEQYERQVSEISTSGEQLEVASEPISETRIQDASDKMIDVDITTENFDFEHYDYYEVLSQYVGIADYPEEEIIDPENEIEKVEDEETILTELADFIEDSKELITSIKEDITETLEIVPETYTDQQMEELQERYRLIHTKVEILKAQYDIVKEKYDFEDFDILASIEMMAAIEDYENKASLEELEMLVDTCKEEIEQIDGVIIEEQRSVGVLEEIKQQKRENEKRDQAFEKNKEGVIYLDSLERRIADEAREQAQILQELNKKLANFQTEVRTVTREVYHTDRMFGSFLRIAAGILTVPFTGRQIFGTMLGTHLINRGLRQLRDSLNPEFVQTQEVRHRYQDIEREILNSKDYVKTTANLIDDSLYQIGELEEEFKLRFRQYTSLIPEYKEVEKKIESLKTSLAKKKEEVASMDKVLDRQYEENKVKVKRAA